MKVHHGLSGCFPEPKNGTPTPTLPTILQPVTTRRNQHLFNTRSCCRGNSAQLQGSSMTSAMTDGRHFPKPEEVDGVDELLCFFTVEVLLSIKTPNFPPKFPGNLRLHPLWCHLPKEIGPSQRTMVVHTKGRFVFSLVCSIIIKGIS